MAIISANDDNVSNGIDIAMLTTIDNPHSPFTEFDAWYLYDTMHGYNSCGLLDRITFSSKELSDLDQQIAIQDAIDEIIEVNASGLHKKVYRNE